MRGYRRAMPRILLTLLAALFAAPFANAQTKPEVRSPRPNVIFVFSDDHATHAMGCYGSTFARTPNLDRLARGGMRFDSTFCGNALCGPSRATVLTGLFSHGNGFMRNGNRFDAEQETFPVVLQRQGYATALFGKWHLESTPRGFDAWAVLPDQGHYYNPDFDTKDGRVREHGHVTDLTTQLALKWLETGRDPAKPFVLMCQHKAPHRNWMPDLQDLELYRDEELPVPATLFDDHRGRAKGAARTEMQVDRDLALQYDLLVEPLESERPRLRGLDASWDTMLGRLDDEQRSAFLAAFRSENEAFRKANPQGEELVRWKLQRYLKNYLRCIAGVDRSVGQLLDWLAAHPEIERNTIVVYSSDQGFFLGDHGYYDKRWMYEESLRMPLLVRWPGHVTEGSVCKALVQNVDFAPTFLEAAGASFSRPVHGRSLLPLLSGTTPADWREEVYYHYYESKATHRVPAHFGVRTERYKLIRYYEPDEDAWELFDLDTDPHELHSLADDSRFADVRRDLEHRLEAARARLADDTGVLAAELPITAGVTRSVRDGSDYRIRANTTHGYAMRATEAVDATRFTVRLEPMATGPQRNGYLVLDDAAGTRIRCGLAFARSRMQVLVDDREKAGLDLRLPSEGPVELVVTIDAGTDTVTAEVLGQRATAKLPSPWRGLAAVGYGASNAETRFSAIELR